MKEQTKKPDVVEEISSPTSLSEIVLDTPAKQEYMRILELYRKQNPVKFASKEPDFIKKMLLK